MSPEQIAHVIRHTFFTAMELAAPFLLLALATGFLISIFQAATQIQEMTLSFVPKMIVIGISLAILFPWMTKILTKFTHNLWITQWEKVTHYVQ